MVCRAVELIRHGATLLDSNGGFHIYRGRDHVPFVAPLIEMLERYMPAQPELLGISRGKGDEASDDK